MKRALFFIAMCAVALVSCSQEGDDTSALLTLTSEEHIDVSADGGEGVITYKLENVRDNVYPSADSSVDWITDVEVGTDIRFKVAANEAEEERTGIIYVSYKKQNFTVTIKQEGAWIVDVEYKAQALNGEYFGMDKSSGAFNYFAIFSTLGTTGLTDLYLDTYYRFDIYTDTPAATNGPLMLPEGVYELDPYSLGEVGTFGADYSLRFQTFESGEYSETFFMDGRLTITKDRVEGIFLMDNGEVHRLVYDGSLELSYLEVEVEGPFSYLSEDYTFDHSMSIFRLFYYGDYYGIGATNWSLTVMETQNPINGDYFTFDIIAYNDGKTIADAMGTYEAIASAKDAAKGKFIAGTMDNSMQYLYSWYKVVEDDYIVQTSGGPMVGGTVTLEQVDTQDGSATEYRLTIDCVDDLGYKVQGSFSGVVCEFYDRTESSVAKLAPRSLVFI